MRAWVSPTLAYWMVVADYWLYHPRWDLHHFTPRILSGMVVLYNKHMGSCTQGVTIHHPKTVGNSIRRGLRACFIYTVNNFHAFQLTSGQFTVMCTLKHFRSCSVWSVCTYRLQRGAVPCIESGIKYSETHDRISKGQWLYSNSSILRHGSMNL